ncbi:monocarboxylate transporter 9-like [Diprion similis]|uniref:monocarboxylate transporter 9-like n=1 Tax=Diprion similis TaxID=362088 RepID=UPI001EF86ABA|nr:monocarboxylate transporter 9-like [Diprion similis]
MSGAPDGGWGWIVVAAVTISNLALLPIQQSFGLVFESRFSELGMTATETSFIFSFTAAIMCSLGLINGPLMKKFSFRTVAYLGTTFIFFGICLAAFAESLGTIIAAYCIFIAIGQGMMYSAISLALNTYFSKKRSVAMGLTITLTGLGPILMPQLIVRFLNSYGTTGTILILAAIALHSFIGASLLRPLDTNIKISDVELVPVVPGDPEAPSHDIETGNKTETANDLSRSAASAAPEEVKLVANLRGNENRDKQRHASVVDDNLMPRVETCMTYCRHILSKIAASLELDLLRNNHFLVIILGMGITLVSEYNFNSMIPLILSELANLTPPEVATVMSVQASADITGRLCVPLITQKFGWPSMNLYAVSLLGSILGRSVLATWSSSYTVIIASSVLLGIAKGTKAVFQALVVPDNVPLARLPAASGLLMVCNGVLSITLGPLIGLVHDKTHSYVGALHFTSALSLSCILLWIGEHVYNSSRKTSKEPNEDGKNCEEN